MTTNRVKIESYVSVLITPIGSVYLLTKNGVYSSIKKRKFNLKIPWDLFSRRLARR